MILSAIMLGIGALLALVGLLERNAPVASIGTFLILLGGLAR